MRPSGPGIKHYMTNILAKLQLRSRVEAALLAHRAGLAAADRPLPKQPGAAPPGDAVPGW